MNDRWTHKQIDEDGGMGSAREEILALVAFAWGKTDMGPGGWQLWAENPDGDLDLVMFTEHGDWTEEEAIRAADSRLYGEMPGLLQGPFIAASVRDVLAERERQIRKGYNVAHDDERADCEIAVAAGLIALGDHTVLGTDGEGERLAYRVMQQHTTERERLVIAAALLIAEVERLDRVAPTPPAPADSRGPRTAM